jgi:hypothetical protein
VRPYGVRSTDAGTEAPAGESVEENNSSRNQ